MSLVRCFVAADLPEEVRAQLGDLGQRLRARGLNLRWVAPSSMHLTLKFLGEVSPEMFSAVSRGLDEGFDVPCPIRLALSGVGAFPSARRARVVWAGMEGDVAALARVALTLDARAERAGIPREARPFSPHLTLGRARAPSGALDVQKILEREAAFRGSAFEVRSLVLYESQLRPGGPIYTPRKTISLQ